ncbi:putative MFS-type transporter YhjX [subsurface metagenome]
MGGAFVPLMSTVARWFVKRRSMMTGIVVAGVGMGSLIAPPVASRLIATYDWRLSYIILGSIVLVVVVLAAQLLRRDPTQIGQMPYGENEGEEPGLKFETRAFPLREAAHMRQFWVVFAIFCCSGFCRYSIIVHIVPHATELGISASSAANILATIGGLSIVGRMVLGTIADRFGNKQVFIISFILMLMALLWLTPAIEAWMLYLFAAVFGLALGASAAASPLVAELFGLSSHGLILGIMSLGLTIGAAMGSFMAGYIFDVAGSYQVAFLVCAAISVFGLILAALL